MLNHKRKGMEGVYERNEELELRAAGFAAWEAFLVELAAPVRCADRLGVPLAHRCSSPDAEQPHKR
jgi:hypothetical protein